MLRTLILLVTAFVFASIDLASATNDTVHVEGGLVSVSVVDEVRIYKGILSAARPVGEPRWKAPQPAAVWEGIRKCDDFGLDCPRAPYSQSSLYYSAPHKQSEDCLYLNVWTAAKADEKRPVMAWIHGGALTRGSDATHASEAYLCFFSRVPHNPNSKYLGFYHAGKSAYVFNNLNRQNPLLRVMEKRGGVGVAMPPTAPDA
jgi:hypothetical protein